MREALQGDIDDLRKDAPRSGRPASVKTEIESHIVQATPHERPANATRWSTRTLADHLGIGVTTVREVLGGSVNEEWNWPSLEQRAEPRSPPPP